MPNWWKAFWSNDSADWYGALPAWRWCVRVILLMILAGVARLLWIAVV